jgi:hypothetical protein
VAKSSAKQPNGKRPGKGGIIPPAPLWVKGQSGNPRGRPAAGATIRERVNIIIESGTNEAELRAMARNKSLLVEDRMAAERILRTLEAPDIADFQPWLEGKCDLVELRERGVNTEAVKKAKVKVRVVPVGDGATEQHIEREIELYDRAGEDFDRIINHTDGQATKKVEVSGAAGSLAFDLGEFAEMLITTFGATRLPPMMRAALDARRGAKQINNTVIEQGDTK